MYDNREDIGVMKETVTTPGGIVTEEVYTGPVDDTRLGMPGE